ncbi:hypothetical protein [Micromonospora thermarum]|uniref:DUF4287 domain-containing protein n=1 Tax=Micromonospora thermarum TaxID=2720024 RepID=A0ABX0ZGG5_9ACTN|nr:hypothetical protein [Micromonospora thermarum]NJP35416.1 hypothetical protein [Micromonospora thermarum]
MTNQRAFKARVRARMGKTGESYTTARRHLLARVPVAPAEPAAAVAPGTEPPAVEQPAASPAPGAAASGPAEPPATSVEEAPAAPAPAGGGTAGQVARIPDALLRERTGRGWEEWFGLLDQWGGTAHAHTEIARWLVSVHEVPGWWAQTITVGYEQARGLRAPGQQRGGGYSAGGSRTVAVPVDRLFAAFADETLRRRWLPDVDVRVRTATAPKTFRADWAGGPTRIVVGFVPAGDTKSRLAVQHEKIDSAERAAELKAYWRERLDVLKRLLETDGDGR